MNNIHDNGENDKSLNADLDRLRSAYRRIEQDEPPELLDQAILNRAHRAVEKKPRWMKFGWLQGLTTTAVFVLAFSIFLHQPESTPLLPEKIGASESTRMDSAKEPKKQDHYIERDSASPAMKSRGAERPDIPVDTPAAAAPVNVATQEETSERPRHSAPETQQLTEANELRLEKREFPVNAARLSDAIPEEVMDDEAGQGNDVLESMATYEIAHPGVVTEPEAEEDKSRLSEESGIERELQAIIELKRSGDDQWITALESFRERHPDYPLPDELTDQEP